MYVIRGGRSRPKGLSVLIFLTPLASILKDLLERVGRPLTEDFSTVNGDGFRFSEAITEAAITDLASAFLFSQSPVYPQL